MLRAKIKSEHKDLIGKVEWFYENEKQNMDNRMRCPTFYKYPVMNILDKALEVLCDLKYYD
jgi:hypothetical protein